MKRSIFLAVTVFLGLVSCPLVPLAQTQSTSELYRNFLTPPKSARPRVWWHWMNGNITEDGIFKDLTWMKKSGIAGFHNFDAGLDTPQIVDKRLIYMTPEWKDAFSYATHLADSLDLEMTIASSPGWSETGGPWVKDEDAMKKLVWRQADVKGGSQVSIHLPDPFEMAGQYQDFEINVSNVSQLFEKKKFYRDIAVIGTRLKDDDLTMAEMAPAVTSSGGKVTLEGLSDEKIADFSKIAQDKDGWCWIQYEFPKQETIKSVIASDVNESGDPNSLYREIQCSDDGISFRTIGALGYQACIEKTWNITPTASRIFRYRVRNSDNDKKGLTLNISKLVLSTVPRVQLAGDKAGFAFYRLLSLESTPETADAPSLEDVVDLTKFFSNGVLTWNAPEGRWRIFRFGYSLTGKCNHPSTPEATGLEVDKLNPDAVREYFRNYLKTYHDASGGMMGKKGIQYLLTDSYEAGPQTWTENIMNEFKKRKGYDMLRWMPALTGMILDSSDETERFLFDWRRTIGEMMAEYHYDLQNEILKPYGMKRYTEAHENFRANLTDGMDCKRYAEVPMSAFWMQYKQGKIFNSRFEADVRESASVAHIYGQNIAAAESFTTNGFRDGAWVFSPAVLKPTADAAMAAGLNRFVIHTSPHQPVDDKVPGIGLGPYGQWFDRHQTWADQAKAWTDYLSRSCYLLQQGKSVADIAYCYGEDNNATGLFLKQGPQIPDGYNYDYFSPSVLLDLAEADNGQIVVPSGMRYNVLVLDPNVRYMSFKVLRKIAQLADSGVTICGAKPEKLASNDASEADFQKLVDSVWNSGRKNVTSGVPVQTILEGKFIGPDFAIYGEDDSDIKFVHRALPNGDIYWVANLSGKSRKFDATFRVTAKKPVIWHAYDGSAEDASYLIAAKTTEVQLNMNQHDAVFVLFLEDAQVNQESAATYSEKTLLNVNSRWTVNFQAGRGAPESAVFDKLESFTESGTEGIKYFSGAATYSNSFRISGKVLQKCKGRIFLDLGEVKDLAEVTVNGQDLGVYWNAPFKVDITKAVRKGTNEVEIKAVNVWHNRLVGDVQPGVTGKITYTQMPFFDASEPLLPAGLLGPVSIKVQVEDK